MSSGSPGDSGDSVDSTGVSDRRRARASSTSSWRGLGTVSSCAPGASNTPMYLGLDELGVDLVGHPGGMLPQHPQDPLDAQHAMDLQPQVDSTRNLSKKRKGSSYQPFASMSHSDGSDFDDDTEDGKSCRTDDKKQNHSEIEKRRRNKMNTYITELSAMVCRNLSRKLDKLTVLRMAVQHLKKIHGSVNSYTEGQYKPAFLSDQELKHLILQTAEGFLFVVGCDRGRILFVSESVSQVLNFSPCDLLGQSWFDILHPKDIRKVKEQISVCPRDRLIDAKTMQPVRADLPAARSRLCPGKRRSFFCRMKRKPAASSGSVKEETDSESCGASAPSSGSAFRKKKPHSADRKYSVIQCTGYVKSWALENMGGEKSELVEGEGGESAGAACLSCLVAVGRLQPAQSPPPRPRPGRPPANTRPLQFTSRHDTVDGKFLFVDQRATLALGYLQQDLLDTSMFEYYHQKDKPHLFESYKTALSGEAVTTKVYGFRKVEGSYTSVQSEWKAFKNPWTKEIEYLIAKNFVIMEEGRHVDSSPSRQNQSSAVRYQAGDDLFSQSTDGKDGRGAREARDGLQKIMEASKSGRKIADDALASQRLRGNGDSSSTSTPSPSRQDCSSVEMKLSPLLSTDGCRGQPGRPSSSNQDPLPSPQLDSAGPDTKSLQQSPLPTSPVSQVSPPGCTVDSHSAGPTNTQPQPQDAAPAEGTSFYGLRLGSLNSEGVDSSAYSSSVRNNVMLSGLATPDPGLANDEDMMEMMTPVMHEFPGGPGEGSDEAAMSVIMSLLEADAGLGGPVDFNGLPWPLP